MLVALALVARTAPGFQGEAVLAVGDDRGSLGVVSEIGGYAIGAGGVLASRDQFGGGAAVAILVHGNAGDVVAAEQGGAAPGGWTYDQLGALAVGAAGAVVFRADVHYGGGQPLSALFEAGAAGQTTRLVADGDPTPLGDGTVFTRVELPAANGRGVVAFRGTDSAGRQGLYRLGGGGLDRIVVKGDPHPAIGTFSTFGAPSVADDGTVAFFASSGAVKGIFAAAPGGAPAALATVGVSGPGGTFTSVDAPAIGPDGTVAFRGVVQTDTASVRGLFLWRAGSVVRLVAEGEAGPGGGSYRTFGDPSVGDGGAVAFRATMTTPAEAVIAILDTTRLVAAAGEEAFAGRFCPAALTQPCFGDPVFGPRGHLAFRAALDDPVVTRALFRTALETEGRLPVIDVDCNAGARIQDALPQVAEGGVVRVRGLCRENVVLAEPGRITIEGLAAGRGRRRRFPVLAAADPARPALEALPTAGPATVVNLIVERGRPAVRLAGVGHVLQGLRLRRGGGIVAAGDGHTVSAARMSRIDGPCLVIAAGTTAVVRSTIRGCRGDGIVVTGPGSSLVQNLVAASRGRGILVESDRNSLVRNRVIGNRRGGLLIAGRDNSLLGNRASANRGGAIVAAPCNLDAGRNRPRVRMPVCPGPAGAARGLRPRSPSRRVLS
jgi:parallel beta-helix repeat protein